MLHVVWARCTVFGGLALHGADWSKGELSRKDNFKLFNQRVVAPRQSSRDETSPNLFCELARKQLGSFLLSWLEDHQIPECDH